VISAFAPSSSSGVCVAARIWSMFSKAEPSSRFRHEVQGTMTTSSWSLPIDEVPLGVSTPTTWKGMFLMRTRLPMGESPAKRLSATVRPTRQVLAEASTSPLSKKSPSSTGQLRTSGKVSPTPRIEPGTQFCDS
jgi:hypothetical protein